MSQRGTEFIERWIQEHFHAEASHHRADQRPAQWAEECVTAAAEAGISKEEIEEDFGDLQEFMERAITEQNELRMEADGSRSPEARSALPT